MSAFEGKADVTVCGSPLSRSLLGVKRTSLFAAHMSANDTKRTSLAVAANSPSSATAGTSILRHLSVQLSQQHDAFRSRGFVARAYEHCRMVASVHCNVQHVCRNEDVIARLHDVAILKLVARPQFHLIAADHVKRSLMVFMHMRPCSLPCWQRDHPEPECL